MDFLRVCAIAALDGLSAGGDVGVECVRPLIVALFEVLVVCLLQGKHGLIESLSHIGQRVLLPLFFVSERSALQVFGLDVIAIFFAEEHAVVEGAHGCLVFLGRSSSGSAVQHCAIIILRMGVVQSKKDGVVKKFELRIDLKAPLKTQLLELTNWSFAEIKRVYDAYARKTDCPFVDFFTFHKIMPFTPDLSRTIFDAYANSDRYVNVFEVICMLILTSHNVYRKKLQFLFVLFDFGHIQTLKNRELILIFECFVNGYCRMSGQPKPKYNYLSRYTLERFVRVNSLEALEKVVPYRRLIEQVEGNNDCFELFKRFDQEIYGYFTQESYLFRVAQYKKYDSDDVQRIYRVIKKANQGNFQEVELEDKNRRFRLQNRKTECIKQLLQEKQLKFKPSLSTRSNSQVLLRTLPPVKSSSKAKINTVRSKVASTHSSQVPALRSSPSSMALSSSPSKERRARVLLLNGKITSKQDIFATVSYFKSLSGNKGEIRAKQFVAGFEKKVFLKKQVSSLFQHFDRRKRGEVSLQDFLRVYYQGITNAEIEVIKEWYYEYRNIHEADNFDISEYTRKKDKKHTVELPKTTLARMDEIFASIDRGHKGYLTLEDLKIAYNTGFSIKELQDMMVRFGKGGKILKPEFIRMTLPEEWTIEGTDYVGA